VLLGWGFVSHVMGGVSTQPGVEGRVLDDPWTFYDPWVVAAMNGPAWTAVVAGVGSVLFVLGSAALASSWRWVAATMGARDEGRVTQTDPSDAAR
jgi:hypothetical protein